MGSDEVIAVTEAQLHLPELLERVERGERIAITRDGVHVATLIPGGRPQVDTTAAVATIMELRERVRREGRGMSLDEILAARDAGRR